MKDTLSVQVNRSSVNAIEPDVEVFETDDTFDVRLQNHGAPVHVYLHLDDDLSRVARLDSPNRYLDRDEVEVARVAVTSDHRPIQGRLEIVTGYGSERTYVMVKLVQPDEHKGRVRVDESLGHRKKDPEPNRQLPEGAARVVPVVVLSGVAVAVTALAMAIMDGLAAVFAGLVVVAGLAAAGYFMLRP